MELSYTKTADEVLEYLSVQEAEGLSAEEVERRRRKYGLNGELSLWLRVQYVRNQSAAIELCKAQTHRERETCLAWGWSYNSGSLTREEIGLVGHPVYSNLCMFKSSSLFLSPPLPTIPCPSVCVCVYNRTTC